MSDLEALSAHFEIEEELDRGGFGVVYKGWARDGAEVAIKIPREGADATELARVVREAALLRRVEHPRLVTFYGAFRAEDDKVALVYERLYGETLLEALQRRLPGAGRAAAWIVQIAEGLDALHEQGLIHRDLKPANVWIQSGGGVKLLDFGLLKPEVEGGTLTETGMLIGTPEYMAPEQFSAARPSRYSDQYAFACLAFRMIAGRAPFTGSPAEVVQGHMKGAVPDISRARPMVPVALDEVFARAMAKTPEERYESCGEFAAEVQRIFQDSELREQSGVFDPADFRSSKDTQLMAPRSISVAADGIGGDWRRRERIRTVLRVGVGVVILGLLGLGGQRLLQTWREAGPAPMEPTTGAAWEHPEFGPDYPAAVAGDLTDAAGWRVDAAGTVLREGGGADAAALLDPDPLRHAARMEALPSLQRWQDWLRQGGEVEGLPGPLVEDLRRAGERFRSERLADPFFPVAGLRPRDEAVDLPEEIDAGALLEGPFRGWRGRAAEALGDLVDLRRRLRADLLLARGEERWPGGIEEEDLSGRATDLGSFLDAAFRTATGRERAARWIAPATRALRAYLYAAGRSLRDEPEGADAAAAVFAGALEGFHPFFHGAVAVDDPEVLVAGTPSRPAGWLLAAATVAGAQATLGALGVDLRGMRATRAAWLRRAAQVEPGAAREPGRTARVSAALEGLAEEPLGHGTLFEELQGSLEHASPTARARLAWALAQHLLEPDAEKPPGEEVAWILKSFSHHRAELTPNQQGQLGAIVAALARFQR